MVGIIVALVVAAGSGVLVHSVKSQQGERSLYFSVATKNTASTGSFIGDNITIFGSGTFDNQGGVDANGIWSIQTSLPPTASNTVASGTWVATSVVSFVSYGVANPRAEGGQLMLEVTFQFDNGTVLNGITLTMTCHVGSPPPTAVEGVTLAGPLSFGTPVTGITVFGAPPE
jgi:hypothetical protein